MKIYDVCNDYSLELSEHTELPKGYTWFNSEVFIGGHKVIAKFGYDKEYKELHFLATDSELNLENQYI